MKGLSKRLLEFYTAKAPRIEVDRKLIDRLKLIEGPKDLEEHERFIKDLESSQDYQRIIEEAKLDFTTTFQVLTGG